MGTKTCRRIFVAGLFVLGKQRICRYLSAEDFKYITTELYKQNIYLSFNRKK